MSCSNRCWASEDSKSYDCSSRTLPAKSSGIMSSLKLRSIAALRAFSARRSSPLFSASMTDCSTAWRSSSKMSSSASAISWKTPFGSPFSSKSWRASFNLRRISRNPCIRSPFGSVAPRSISRRKAPRRSPFCNKSSDISSKRSLASRSNPVWVPSHREYVDRAVICAR